MTVGTASPSVFDTELPTLDYDAGATPPHDVYPQLLAAQRLAPIAMGPLGPEVLSYELVRTVLRDSRFQIPSGYIIAVQGITSGPLWDKVMSSLLGMEGGEHQRVRSVVSKAFTPYCWPALTPRETRWLRPSRSSAIIRISGNCCETSPTWRWPP